MRLIRIKAMLQTCGNWPSSTGGPKGVTIQFHNDKNSGLARRLR